MQNMRFYVESQKHRAISKLLGFLAVLPGVFTLVTLFLKASGERGSLIRTMVKISIPCGIIAAVLIAWATYVYFKNRKRFTLTYLPQGGMQIIIRDPDGREHGASGQWSCHALYTKHYHKYGTYRKEIYVILFCNDQMFCVLEHEVAPAFPPPQGFRELQSAPVVTVPWYHTKHTEAIYGRVNGMIYTQPLPVQNTQSAWRDTQY
jgi:hypothetical protein